MKLDKLFLVFVACALALAVAAFAIFNYSVEFARGTKDPDLVEFYWAVGSLGIMLLPLLFGFAALITWIYHKKKLGKVWR